MKRITLTLILLLLMKFVSFGQYYGNEWIDYNQKFFSFPILSDGIYKIDYATLVSNNIDPKAFSSENMQVFGRQQEVALHVYDGNDNSMDPGDFFIFYGLRNNGWLDTVLYAGEDVIGNPAISLFNDTINYFFTWNNSSNNLRFKIEDNLENVNVFQPLSFGMTKLEYTVANPVYFQAEDRNRSSSSFFVPGEGFATGNMNGVESPDGAKIVPYFYTSSLYTDFGAPFARFESRSSSNSDADSIDGKDPLYNHHLRVSIGKNLVADTLFKGHQHLILRKNIPATDLTNYTTEGLFHIVNDLNLKADQQVFSYMSLVYPRKTVMYGSKKDKFSFKNAAAGSVRVDMTNASINLTDPIVLVMGDVPKKVAVSFVNDTVKAMVTNSSNGTDQEFIIMDSSLIIPIVQLKAVNGTGFFTNYDATDFNQSDIIIYHPKLEIASKSYAAYRSSGEGGSYKVVLANIEELYLQFGGGIPKHNAAIRRLCSFAYDKSVQKPIALTILGKGFGIDKTRNSPDYYKNSLVPPYGYPSSDICHTAGLYGTVNEPLIPTGRVSAQTEEELYNYLDKLMVYEALQDTNAIYSSETKDWQKQVLHFSGGDTGELIDNILTYMGIFKGIITKSYYAGNVTTFTKSTSNPYDPTMVTAINKKIKSGASLLNFFGHSTASGFDISVDDPSNWDNEGKYPIILGNGCYAGNMFDSNEKSFSEKVVLLPKEGGIAMLASTANEYANNLFQYNKVLYDYMSLKSYGAPFAQQIKQTIKLLQDSLPPGFATAMLNSYGALNLHGDPLVRLNWHKRPEIELRPENVYFEPSEINLSVDTIDFNIILKNLGPSVVDSFDIEIIRNFPNSSVDSIYKITLQTLHYMDTITLRLPLQAGISIGINKFQISVDLPSYIDEQYDEVTNNQLTKTLFIKLDAIVPVYPSEFAVIPTNKTSVKGSTLNPINTLKKYHFELDITDEFNSDFLRHYSMTEVGGVKEVKYDQWLNKNGITEPLICEDSVVYFWRVATDSSELVWHESSFQYIQTKEGWGQDHFFQFKKNDFNSIDYKKTQLKRDFAPVTKTLQAFGTHNIAWSPASYHIDLEKLQVDYGQCGGHTLICVAVFDSLTLNPWFTRYQSINPDNNFGNMNDDGGCAGRPMGYFAFIQDDPAQMSSFRDFIDNKIPKGNYVMMWTTVNGKFSTWDPAMFTTFANFGATSIVQSSPDRSFIIFGKQGYPQTVIEELVPLANIDDVDYKLSLLTELHSIDYLGSEVSTTIGPAQKWKTIYWKQSPVEMQAGDTTYLSILAKNIYGDTQFAIDTLFTLQDSILDLNQLISATNYPYLSLKATYEDKVNLTPADMQRWHVLYEPAPEAAIDGSAGYVFEPIQDTLNEGQVITVAADIRNISDYPMDSMLVSYWIEDQYRIRHYLPNKRLDSLRVGQVIRDTISFSTLGYAGINSFWMEINPYKDTNSGETDQPEQFHFNNLLQIPFFVHGDDVNPILDVTFNGRHILNGDIVDPNSEIYITLKDDNPYLLMNDISDTTLFGIFLTPPGGQITKIPFIDGQGNSILQWTGAESTFKKFNIVYPAYFAKDGTYTLLVQGSDRTGNLSGDLDYRITFEVIHESTITALTNYPNPFSTSTRFVFTLTGSEVPDDMLIQILTITGKVVREITKDELGPIQIGRNITEFSWNGTDQFGDPLANGVYLYRVQSRLNGTAIKHRDSEIDSYFKKGFGKMYLMR